MDFQSYMIGESDLKKRIDSYDALPYFDLEYNHPSVQQAVLSAIEEEMRSFQPKEGEYLGDLPYPRLKFRNAPGFQREYERILAKTNASGVKVEEDRAAYRMESLLDVSRYSVPGPANKRDKGDVLFSLNNAKAQYRHQQTRVSNLEQATNDDNAARQSEELRTTIESTTVFIQNHIRDLQQQQNKLNMDRMNAQRVAMSSIVKITGKRDHALYRVQQLRDAVSDLKQKRAKTGT